MDTKAGGGGTTKMLKNGITLGYSVDKWEATIDDGTKSGDQCYGLFWVDVMVRINQIFWEETYLHSV